MRGASGAALAAGVLAALAAVWSGFVFMRNLDAFALGVLAPGYRPAVFTVTRVSEWPFGPLLEGTIEGKAEAIRAADLGPSDSGALTPGATVRVLYDPAVPSVSLNGHELRVVAFDPDFVQGERARLAHVVLVAYLPILLLLTLAVGLRRAERVPVKGVVTVPAIVVGLQAALVGFLVAYVLIDRAQAGPGGRFDAVMGAIAGRWTGLAALVLLPAGALLVAARMRRKRRHRLARAADGLRLSFAMSAEVPAELAGFDLFDHRSVTFENWMRGDYGGVPITVVDHSYTTGHNTSAEQTAVAYGPGAWSGPPLRLTAPPLGPVQRRQASPPPLPEVVVAEGTPFAEAYVVRAAETDGKAVRAIFSSLVTDFFATRPGWTVETRDRTILLYRYGELVRPEKIQAFLAQCDEVRQVLGGGGAR